MVDISGQSLDDAVMTLADAINALPVSAAPVDAVPAVVPVDLTTLNTKVDRLEKEVFDAAEIAAFPENVVA